MDIIRFTITNPVKVAVGVLLVGLFGTLALFDIPIQLTPNVDEPRVTVTTRWSGKSAREIEREIIERQEEKLKGVSGLRKLTSEAVEGQGTVTLEFFVGVDKDVALRETDQKLNQVSDYPPDVEKPEVVAADAAMETPIAWLMLRSRDGTDVTTLRDYVWDEVKPILERVEGLSSVNVYGGREREVHVLVDPDRLAARGLTLRDIESALRAQNVNVSAGTIESGKRDFIYRTVGEYEDTSQIDNTVIAYRDGGPIFVRDVGRAVKTHEKPRAFVRSKGEPVLAIPAHRETGSNVIVVMEGLKQQVAKVNEEILTGRGLELELMQIYDETRYIHSSIRLVRNNLIYGGALASLVLLLFLRNVRATAVVAFSIPVSVIATFLAVSMLGRNINVVMLAGMAFAVGMVVDNAIVVLENIYRHRQMGKSSFQAALDGASEVWGAILASTLTTMAVFLPVIFIEEEAGQLFRDISIAISAGVFMSLLVSVLVIPTLSARVLGQSRIKASEQKVGRLAWFVGDMITWVNRGRLTKLAVIAVFLVGSLVGSWALLPPTDYLPAGNRNMVFGFMLTEPGLGLTEFGRIADELDDYLRPYWSVEPGTPEAAAIPPVMMRVGDKMVPVTPPPINNFFFVSYFNNAFMGVTSRDDENVASLVVLLQQALASCPSATGANAFFQQVPLFGGGDGGNTIDVEIRSSDLSKVNAAAAQILAECFKRFGFARPVPPSFDLPRPEIRAIPDLVRAADVGLSVSDVGFIIAAGVDGAYVGGFRDAGDEIDMLIKLENADGSPLDEIHQIPIFTPTGRIVPLESVTRFEYVGAPQQINHIEAMPGVTLQVPSPIGMAIETVMNTINDEIVAKLRAQGRIDPTVYVSLAGNADKLVQTRTAMFGRWDGWNLESVRAVIESRGFLALLVVYLLMAALFESFIHPLAILLTVPLAAVGGLGGLRIVHWMSLRDPVSPVQQLDVVTMLGFVILLGIVVNNAILIVHQTLNNITYGMKPEEALPEAVRTRLRPIFMTALTTVFGQLPLALMPGAGSELYRGLAAVMVGGLLVATVFTLVLVPVAFSMFLSLRGWWLHLLGRDVPMALRPVGLDVPPLRDGTASADNEPRAQASE
ncbi:MAG: efflux RND transporter permease subunit [Phycisphaerae bacterium]|nr:efflux RND transporter permease subunit [Phycisphaerae bacterium]